MFIILQSVTQAGLIVTYLGVVGSGMNGDVTHHDGHMVGGDITDHNDNGEPKALNLVSPNRTNAVTSTTQLPQHIIQVHR